MVLPPGTKNCLHRVMSKALFPVGFLGEPYALRKTAGRKSKYHYIYSWASSRKPSYLIEPNLYHGAWRQVQKYLRRKNIRQQEIQKRSKRKKRRKWKGDTWIYPQRGSFRPSLFSIVTKNMTAHRTESCLKDIKFCLLVNLGPMMILGSGQFWFFFYGV